jgi:ankyrin repeat protein
MPTVHETILTLGSSLDYLLNDQGCCHGFTLKWLEACILGEREHFNERIRKILAEPTATLVTKISDIKAKVKKHDDLNKDELELLEIPAFYEGITLYQTPFQYVDIFKQHLTQSDVDKLSFFASSLSIERLSGLKKIYSEPGIYTKEELGAYLEKLMCFFREENQSRGLLLSSSNHTMGLYYDVIANSWTMMDINQWSDVTLDQAEIIECLWGGFNPTDSFSYIAFDMQIITPSSQEYNASSFEILKQECLDAINPLLAERNADVNLLFIAAQNGHIDCVRALIKALVDNGNAAALNIAMPDGITPLLTAVCNGHIACVHALIKALVDNGHAAVLNMVGPYGATPLFMAAEKGHIACVHALIKALVENDNAEALNTVAPGNVTPLFTAAYHGHIDCVRALIKALVENGNAAALNTARFDGTTPLFMAAQNGHVDCVYALIKALVENGNAAALNTGGPRGAPPLFVAAEKGQVDCVHALIKALVENGNAAALNTVGPDGATPLFMAAQNGHVACVRALIKALVENGNAAALNMGGPDGVPPLFIAAQNGHIDCVHALIKALVENGNAAALNTARFDGLTPLLMAAYQGYLACVNALIKALVENGHAAVLNMVGPYGATPLFMAAQYGHIDCVNALLANGANPDLSLSDHTTPMSIAIVCGHFDIAYILLEKMSAPPTNIPISVELLRTFIQRYPLDKQNQINKLLLDKVESTDTTILVTPKELAIIAGKNVWPPAHKERFTAIARIQKDSTHEKIKEGTASLCSGLETTGDSVLNGRHNGFLGAFFTTPETNPAKKCQQFSRKMMELTAPQLL